MELVAKRAWGIALIGMGGFVLVACQSPERRHRVTEREAGTTIACQLCYDEAVRALAGPQKHRRYTTVLKHRCPGCYSDVSIYEDNGTLVIQCAKCVPEGVACDKCLPPGPPVN